MYDTKNYAKISLSALAHNYRLLCRHVAGGSSPARPICVVKADAYGHGMTACVRALVAAGADFFAVSNIAEALEVRRAAPSADIMILSYTRPANAPLLAENRIIQTVHNKNYAVYLHTALDAAKASGVSPKDARLSVHLKLDSGMNRLGFPLNDLDFERSIDEILEISVLANLSVEAAFTHFSSADEPDSPLTDMQNARFRRALAALKERGLPLAAHAANSAAAIRFGSMGYDYVRLGIALYGISPVDESFLSGLCPVMGLYSSISEIHLLRKGETVSYGATFSAPKDTRIATVSIGYADGLLRMAGKGGSLIVDGVPLPIVGRICMDQCMIDLGDVEAYEGDRVVVYDSRGVNLRDLARAAGTIPYELLCLTGRRVSRRYVNEMLSDTPDLS